MFQKFEKCFVSFKKHYNLTYISLPIYLFVCKVSRSMLFPLCYLPTNITLYNYIKAKD